MTKMTRYLQLEDGHKIHKNTKEMREVKKELMFHRLLTILFATALILSGVTYDLTSNSLEYQGLMIANVMDDFENIQMILDLTMDRYDELLKVIQLAKYDSGIDSNVTGNSTDRILEKYSPERRQKMNHELRFISPRKYNTFRCLFQFFYHIIQYLFHCKFLKMLEITLSSFRRKNLCTYWI